MFLGACKYKGVRFYLTLLFELKNGIFQHLSGKIQVPLCQNLCFWVLAFDLADAMDRISSIMSGKNDVFEQEDKGQAPTLDFGDLEVD